VKEGYKNVGVVGAFLTCTYWLNQMTKMSSFSIRLSTVAAAALSAFAYWSSCMLGSIALIFCLFFSHHCCTYLTQIIIEHCKVHVFLFTFWKGNLNPKWEEGWILI